MRKYCLIAVILPILTGCSQKVSVEQRCLDPDSPLGYTAITNRADPKAYLLLFPGFGESPSEVLAATELPLSLARHDMAVFIPVLQHGSESYGFSDESQKYLDEIVADIQNRYHLHDKPYFAGGFSMGGATAIKYAEHAVKKPSALFAIDSPLDYQRFLYATKRDIEIYGKNDQDSIYGRLYAAIDKIKGESPYEIGDTTHSAIIPLKNIPVRIYIEPAEDWWLNNCQTDALGLNIVDVTCFINDLRLIGNRHADLIVTHDRGLRQPGKQRHPHSWTIVNDNDLILWLEANLKP